ncbi:hypothetical protein BJI67_02900 [Acidihalobacter aeolianus]|uniref:diguanylate cyclase n=1 Tax=Acidihalobacter aeolianus TaxID=2792603 RepID=A0A1D8K5C9_9GAMM|nr:sensor domain-containing diguanylate cyclase [Acidihalobacter aeolianus]AOV16154.1 hypothetical protein BJI67_02900 [Acidihalobacter aeolianus]
MNDDSPQGDEESDATTGLPQHWLFDLHRLTVDHFDDADAFAEGCLEAGRQLLGLNTAAIGRVENGAYTLLHIRVEYPEQFTLERHPLAGTCCEAVARSHATVCLPCGDDPPSQPLRHPAYPQAISLAAFIGTPIIVRGTLYAILSFSSETSPENEFGATQAMLVEFMASLLGRFMERGLLDRERETALRHMDERQALLEVGFHHGLVGRAVVDVDNSRITDVNPALCRMLGYPHNELLDNPFERFTHPEDRGLTAPEIRKLVRGNCDAFEMEKRYVHHDGHTVHAHVGIAVLRDAAGHARYLIGDLLDVTEHKNSERALREAMLDLTHLSVTDALTGLHNRRSLDEVLKKEIARARRSHTPLSLLLLDIDHFKRYNDAHGHPAGDQALRQSARLILEAIRTTDLATRYGGEEFAIVLPDTPATQAAVLAERCRRAFLDEPWDFDDPLTASFGVAALGDRMQSPDELIQRADEALYEAKAQGRNRVITARLD